MFMPIEEKDPMTEDDDGSEGRGSPTAAGEVKFPLMPTVPEEEEALLDE